MGNTGSSQPSKTRKNRKKEANDGVDDHPERNTKRRAANVCRTRPKRKGTIRYRATNPFIIFFLRLRSKKPKEHVTVIAKAAGRLWTQMTPDQRKKYIDLANAEKKRREGIRKTRKSRRRKR